MRRLSYSHTLPDPHPRPAARSQSTSLSQGSPALPDVVASLVDLGNVAINVDDVDEARRYYTEALPLLSKAHGADHPRVAAVHNNLAAVAFREGRVLDAMRSLRRALQIRVRVLGDAHADTLNTRLNLARIALARNDTAIARTLAERVVRDAGDHPEITQRAEAMVAEAAAAPAAR